MTTMSTRKEERKGRTVEEKITERAETTLGSELAGFSKTRKIEKSSGSAR